MFCSQKDGWKTSVAVASDENEHFSDLTLLWLMFSHDLRLCPNCSNKIRLISLFPIAVSWLRTTQCDGRTFVRRPVSIYS